MAGHDPHTDELAQLRRRVAELESRLETFAEVERELDDYRERWRRVVENSPDVILLIDRGGVIEYISRPHRPAEEVLGSVGFDYLVDEHREAMQATVANVFATGETAVQQIREKDEGLWYSVRLAPLEIEGRVESVVVICTDITQQKMREHDLHEQGARLRLMLRQLPAIMFTTDRQLRFTSSQGAGLAGLGLEPDEVVGMTVHDYFGADEAAQRPLLAMNNALKGRSDDFEIEFQAHTYQTLIEPLRDEEGQIEGTIGVALDITERKEAEKTLLNARDALERSVAERTRELRWANRQLREDISERERIAAQLRASEKRFRVLAEASPIPVVITETGTGEMLYVNPRMAELLRISESELIGRHTTEFYDNPADRASLLESMKREGTVRDREIRLKRADGELLWVSVSMRDIDYNGRQCLYAGLVDISKTKQDEESLLAERRLLKRLLELHERDRQLIAYEIHDGIVQDMTAAGMFVDAAQHAIADRTEPAQRLEHAGKLLRASIAEARRMINGLRPPILEDQGLVAAVENLVEEITSTAQLDVEWEHDVRFSRIAPALELAVYRVVQEGLNNVWQHSGSRAARVALTQSGDEVRITVQDWGCGFDPSKVTTRRYGLLGIRERARLLGGRAQISSAPGQGTRIDVVLPLADVLLPDDATETGLKSSGR